MFLETISPEEKHYNPVYKSIDWTEQICYFWSRNSCGAKTINFIPRMGLEERLLSHWNERGTFPTGARGHTTNSNLPINYSDNRHFRLMLELGEIYVVIWCFVLDGQTDCPFSHTPKQAGLKCRKPLKPCPHECVT